MNNITPPATKDNVQVKRAKHGYLTLYEVREDELETLERGGTATSQLNFSIFFLSIAFTSILALMTSEFKSPIMLSIFSAFSWAGIGIGIYFLIQWKRSKSSVDDVISKIRKRLNGESSIEITRNSSEEEPQ